MQALAMLTPAEDAVLLNVIQAGTEVQNLRQFFLWSQGPLRALLPHDVLVCLRLNEQGRVTHADFLHSVPQAQDLLATLVDPVDGLALRIARQCIALGRVACLLPLPQAGMGATTVDGSPRDAAPGVDNRAWGTLCEELRAQGLRNVLAQGSGALTGGATFFTLFGLPDNPNQRDAFALSMLLPQLHMAYLRVLASRDASVPPLPPAVPLSERELEVLGWVVCGKSNPEIGLILSLSRLTVKNHLQRIFRKLNVHNRVQAITRCRELKLLVRGER
jgi:transcriptional regulator EpsA